MSRMELELRSFQRYSLAREFHQTFREESIQVLYNVLQRTERKGTQTHSTEHSFHIKQTNQPHTHTHTQKKKNKNKKNKRKEKKRKEKKKTKDQDLLDITKYSNV
jgi:acyl-CoA hydrolase